MVLTPLDEGLVDIGPLGAGRADIYGKVRSDLSEGPDD